MPALHRLLFEREELPVDPAAEDSRRGLVERLLEKEELPEDPPRMPEPTVGFRRVFSRERLEEPDDGDVPARREGGVSLRWLFKREELDPEPGKPGDDPTVR